MKNLTVIQKWNNNQEYNVSVEHNQSIQINCTYMNVHNPKPTEVKFLIGDSAEYSSYNLSYIGTIISITEKTVTIKDNFNEVHRLKLENFCWRNFNFNLEKVTESNRLESYCI